MLSNSYFPPRHVWLWLIEIEEGCVCVCVWEGVADLKPWSNPRPPSCTPALWWPQQHSSHLVPVKNSQPGEMLWTHSVGKGGWVDVDVGGGLGPGGGREEVGGLLRSGWAFWRVFFFFFLCVWRDLSTVIYFTSPKQIRQDVSTQAENWWWRWVLTRVEGQHMKGQHMKYFLGPVHIFNMSVSWNTESQNVLST